MKATHLHIFTDGTKMWYKSPPFSIIGASAYREDGVPWIQSRDFVFMQWQWNQHLSLFIQVVQKFGGCTHPDSVSGSVELDKMALTGSKQMDFLSNEKEINASFY